MRRGVTPGVKVATSGPSVVAIFACLAGCVTRVEIETAKRSWARAQIHGFKAALGSYKQDTGTYPNTAQGLKALREKPEGVNGWQGPYLQKDLPKDPWKNEYVYKYPGDHGDEPDVISYGLDGKPGGDVNDADIVSWSIE